MSYKNTHGSGTNLLCASSALGRGQHQKQLDRLPCMETSDNSKRGDTCVYIDTRKKILRKMKNVSYSHI